jgi:hypothetical protein
LAPQADLVPAFALGHRPRHRWMCIGRRVVTSVTRQRRLAEHVRCGAMTESRPHGTYGLVTRCGERL